MNKKINVGILGIGRIGKLHAANIKAIPDAQLVAAADPYADAASLAWAKSMGIDNVLKDTDAVFDNPDIDAVFICSSTDSHTDFIIKAARAGKHIFCEKPIGFDIDKIKQALEEVEKANVKLQLGFVRRFDHNHKRVHDMVREGKVGEPHIIKISSRDPQRPPEDYVRVSGGIFVDMMIHDFDMARYLAGSEVEEIYATGAVLIDQSFAKYGDVDTAMVVLKFKNGALGFIDNSRETNYGYDQRVEVFGSKGCAVDENDSPNRTTLITAEGVYQDRPLWYFLERYNDAFIAETKAFFDAIIADTAPVVTGIDGLRSVQIAYAANESIKTGKPVKVDL